LLRWAGSSSATSGHISGGWPRTCTVRAPTGGSVMGSIYPRGRIYWLKDDTIPRETGRAGAIREPAGTET